MRSEFCIQQQPKPAQNVSTFYFQNCDQIKCNEEVVIVRIHIYIFNIFQSDINEPQLLGQVQPRAKSVAMTVSQVAADGEVAKYLYLRNPLKALICQQQKMADF